MISIFTWIAFWECKTDESIATPCSVKTIGAYLVPPRFEVANCDIKQKNVYFFLYRGKVEKYY